MADVLAAASEEFVLNGYRAATMDVIAQRADVSKRTLYCWYADKSALFLACILKGASLLPRPRPDPERDLAHGLRAYARDLMRELSSGDSYGFAQLVAREGRDFPELVEATRRGHDLYLMQPLAEYLVQNNFAPTVAKQAADLFIAMALADVNRALLHGHPMPTRAGINVQARFVTQVFLAGCPRD